MTSRELSKLTDEELITAKTKLNIAWDCAYSIQDYDLCDIITERIGRVSAVLVMRNEVVTCERDCSLYRVCTLREIVNGLNAENCSSYEEWEDNYE